MGCLVHFRLCIDHIGTGSSESFLSCCQSSKIKMFRNDFKWKKNTKNSSDSSSFYFNGLSPHPQLHTAFSNWPLKTTHRLKKALTSYSVATHDPMTPMTSGPESSISSGFMHRIQFKPVTMPPSRTFRLFPVSWAVNSVNLWILVCWKSCDNEVLLVIRVICVPLCVGDFSFEIVQMPIDPPLELMRYRIVAAV